MERKNVVIGVCVLAIVAFGAVLWQQSSKIRKLEAVQNTAAVQPDQTRQSAIENQDKYRASLEYAEGQVEKRLDESGGWKTSERGDVFTSGMEVRTLAGAKAVLTFEDGSIARLDENTQVKIINKEGNITLEMPSGSVFNRVTKNADRQYVVSTNKYDVRALGTIFTVSTAEEKPEVMVLESQVEIKNDKAEVIDTVQTGEKATFAQNKTEKKKIEDSDLKKKFIAWNMEKDKMKNADVVAVKEDEKKDEKNDSEIVSKIVLSGKTSGSGVKLSWSTQNVSGFEGFKLVKSEGANPVYPGDDYVYLSDTSVRSYDWEIGGGKKYHFRVCKYAGGKCVLYSNDIYLKASEGESSDGDDYASNVELSVKKDGGKAKLSWSISGGSAPKGFKVVSSKNKNPEYPTRSGDEYQYLSDSSARSYTWSGFSSGKTYHFRVCIYKGGSCGKYSNDVEVSF
jgi:hypothetical protein